MTPYKQQQIMSSIWVHRQALAMLFVPEQLILRHFTTQWLSNSSVGYHKTVTGYSKFKNLPVFCHT